jgi:hypothetical protein
MSNTANITDIPISAVLLIYQIGYRRLSMHRMQRSENSEGAKD